MRINELSSSLHWFLLKSSSDIFSFRLLSAVRNMSLCCFFIERSSTVFALNKSIVLGWRVLSWVFNPIVSLHFGFVSPCRSHCCSKSSTLRCPFCFLPSSRKPFAFFLLRLLCNCFFDILHVIAVLSNSFQSMLLHVVYLWFSFGYLSTRFLMLINSISIKSSSTYSTRN